MSKLMKIDKLGMQLYMEMICADAINDFYQKNIGKIRGRSDAVSAISSKKRIHPLYSNNDDSEDVFNCFTQAKERVNAIKSAQMSPYTEAVISQHILGLKENWRATWNYHKNRTQLSDLYEMIFDEEIGPITKKETISFINGREYGLSITCFIREMYIHTMLPFLFNKDSFEPKYAVSLCRSMPEGHHYKWADRPENHEWELFSDSFKESFPRRSVIN